MYYYLGVWGSWSAWSSCSVSCGTGERRRSRQCEEGQNCPGLGIQLMACSEIPCKGLV